MYLQKRRGALAATATCLAFAVIAAACGDDSSDSSASNATTAGAAAAAAAATTAAGPTTTAAPASDPAGVIKVAARNISATGMPLDPIKVGNLTLQTYNALVYDTLLYDDGKDLSLGLAKRVDVVSKTQLEIELPANAKFTDGTAVDGEALKFSLERSIASNARTAFDGLLFTAVDSIVVKSPTVVTINLKAPVAGAFRALLARGEGMIVSPTAVKAGTDLATKPVGAGPFVLDKLDINGTTSFKKNPAYVNADAIKVAGIDFVNVADATAATNALRSGVVDFINQVDNATASTLNAKPYATIQQVSGNRYITLSLCLSQPPLNNLQVRQALNYALDKDAMNNALFDGKGEVMADMWPKSSPYFTAQSGVGFDQKKAKDLLTQANVGPITLRAVVDPTSPTTARLFELAQAQLKEVGITLTQVTTTNIAVDFFNTGNPASRKGDVAALVTSFIGINRVRPFITGFPANACGFTDPTLEGAAADIRSADAGSADAKAAWAKFDKFVFDNALAVWGVWATDISAYNSDRLGGVSLVPDPSGGLVMNFVKTFVKKK